MKRKAQPMKEKRPEEPNYLFLDVEVTGLPQNFQAPVSDTENWPRMVKLHWIYKGKGIEEELATGDYLIKPQDYSIPKAATLVHGISTEFAKEKGVDLQETLEKLLKVIRKADYIVGYNIGFDVKVVASELIRNQMEDEISTKEMIDTIVKKNETYEFMGFEYKPNPRPLYLRFSDVNKFLFDMDDPDFEIKTSTFESVEWQVKQFYKMKELIEKHQLRKAVND